MHFSSKSFIQLKNRLKRRYKSRFNKLTNELNLQAPTKTCEWLNSHSDGFSEFTPLHWYFLEQVETLIYFLKHQSRLSVNEDFTSIDDEVFERWNRSEFADIFLKSLNQGNSISLANKKTMKCFDEHLVSLGNFHILKTAHPNKSYRIQTSLGDQKKKNIISPMLAATLHLDGKELKLMTNSMREMKLFSSRIELALKIIKSHSPTSWERFAAFTEVIIPINQEEFVSYSHQELPGTSMINLYNRDFVDLMDDLIHENGHHHLNYYLNLDNLIEEPIDCIYYSPWRRTLRPLRGIYHAYFTFFWAFKLFADLAFSLQQDTTSYPFNESEQEKMAWRAIEEFQMLNFTFNDLKWAYKKQLISIQGWELIKEQQKYLKKYSKKISQLEKQLKIHQADNRNLKTTLKSATKKFLKK
jgi:hypothetical protein